MADHAGQSLSGGRAGRGRGPRQRAARGAEEVGIDRRASRSWGNCPIPHVHRLPRSSLVGWIEARRLSPAPARSRRLRERTASCGAATHRYDAPSQGRCALLGMPCAGLHLGCHRGVLVTFPGIVGRDGGSTGRLRAASLAGSPRPAAQKKGPLEGAPSHAFAVRRILENQHPFRASVPRPSIRQALGSSIDIMDTVIDAVDDCREAAMATRLRSQRGGVVGGAEVHRMESVRPHREPACDASPSGRPARARRPPAGSRRGRSPPAPRRRSRRPARSAASGAAARARPASGPGCPRSRRAP